MTDRPMTRRAALSLLSALPFGARVGTQPRPKGPRRVFTGRYHSLLLESDGTLKCWSTPAAQTPNAAGELGQGHFNPLKPYTLYQVPGLSNVVAAGAGWDASFAVLADGRILAWGTRGGGILGITPLAEVEVSAEARPGTPTPTAVAARFDAVDVSVGEEHVLALARDGTVWAWGEGGNGRLGVGPLPVIQFKTHTPAPMSYQVYPIQVPGLSDVAAISAGGDHSMALLKDGTVLAWGNNKYGQLGDGTTIDRATPVPVKGLGKAISIEASSLVSLAVLADGTVSAWGSDAGGALGRPPWSGGGDPNPVPRPVPGVTGARVVSGGGTGIALTNAGTVISWGYNSYGQTGQGTTNGNTGIPAAMIKGLKGVQWIRLRDIKGVAVLEDGRIFNWGGVSRPWISPAGRSRFYSPSPMLLSVDGLENP